MGAMKGGLGRDVAPAAAPAAAKAAKAGGNAAAKAGAQSGLQSGAQLGAKAGAQSGAQSGRHQPGAKPGARPDDVLSIRIDLASGARIGPGKIALLEAIAASGSISGAGRALKMSYKRAWDLAEDLNKSFAAPLIATATGGNKGGGAQLTDAGRALVSHYRDIEAAAHEAARPRLRALGRLASGGAQPGKA